MSVIDELGRLLDELAAAEDPLQEVRAVEQLDRAVRRTRASVVRNAISATSYTKVAAVLGVSRQATAKAWPNVRTGRA